jgi:PAS domain-containing protein
VFDIFETVTDTPVIIVTGSGNEEVAVRAMKAGAFDYIVRDHKLNYLKVLPLTIENAIRRKRAEERLLLLESAFTNANDAIIILEAEPREHRGRSILYVNEAFTEMTGYSLKRQQTRHSGCCGALKRVSRP